MDRRIASVAPEQGTLDGIDPQDLKNPALYINRELGWLEFNRRVLAQASDSTHPLLERVKFLGITGANLDEFFMIRLATTMRKLREGIEDHPPDGLDMASQLHADAPRRLRNAQRAGCGVEQPPAPARRRADRVPGPA